MILLKYNDLLFYAFYNNIFKINIFSIIFFNPYVYMDYLYLDRYSFYSFFCMLKLFEKGITTFNFKKLYQFFFYVRFSKILNFFFRFH